MRIIKLYIGHCPIGVTVWLAPVYLVSGRDPHMNGSSKSRTQRARNQFEVGLSGPHSETLNVQMGSADG